MMTIFGAYPLKAFQICRSNESDIDREQVEVRRQAGISQNGSEIVVFSGTDGGQDRGDRSVVLALCLLAAAEALAGSLSISTAHHPCSISVYVLLAVLPSHAPNSTQNPGPRWPSRQLTSVQCLADGALFSGWRHRLPSSERSVPSRARDITRDS
jgi:hypothetical protein